MAQAFDEFDNLIFETECNTDSKEDRDKFYKKVIEQFEREETDRMNLYKGTLSERLSGLVPNKSNTPKGLREFENLEEIADVAREAGLKLKKIFKEG